VVRALAAATAITAIPLAAPAVADAATASAAGGPASAAAGFTWHRLTLINGWQSAGGTDGTGNPAWAVRNGITYLSGSVRQASGTSPLFAVLPPAARPARVLFISVYAGNNMAGHIDVDTNGDLVAVTLPESTAQTFTSLAAVSFPAARIALHKLTLRNGWQANHGGTNTGGPAYAAVGGVVYLSGGMQQPGSGNTEFAVLPKAARPAHQTFLIVYTNNFTTGTVEIFPDGRMFATGSGSRALTSLAGISYTAAGVTSRRLALINGWTSEASIGTGNPSYTVIGGVVYLAGSMHQLTGTNTHFAVLPKSARPAHYLLIKTWSNGDTVGIIAIRPNGDMFSFGSPGSRPFTSLAAISYPLGS